MEKTIKPVTVRILDKDYVIACPEGEQGALVAAAKRVDKEMRRIRETGKVLGTDRIAVMVALNLAHELLHNPPSAAPALNLSEPIEKMEKLQQRVEETLERHKR